MGVRAIRARIECNQELLLHLWRTHRVFNERLPSLITRIFAMRHGKIGAAAYQRDLYQRIAEFTLACNSKDAPYLLNSVSIKGWKPATALKKKVKLRNADGTDQEHTGGEWAKDAADLSAKGTLAFDKEVERDGLPDSIFQPLMRDAVAYISGHNELVRNWEKERAEWLDNKKRWEDEPIHKKYLALRPRFEAFQNAVGGKSGKRRERWHLYLKWLNDNPDLAGWRGGLAEVKALGEKAKARIANAKPWKQRSVEAEEFWKANPELAALDKLHGIYSREFIRRRRTKRNKWKEGFKQRPTFTMPDPVLHPRWALFNAPQTSPQGYSDLKLPPAPGEPGSVRLRLLTGERDANGWPEAWISVRFRADPRLAHFVERTVTRTIGKRKRKGQPTATKTYRFVDTQLGDIERPAQISGAKLIFKDIKLNDDGSLKSATPFLVFACTIDDLPLTDRARAIQWSETGEVTKTGKKRKSKKLPDGLVSCAVDLGIRNLGFLTLAVSGNTSNDGSLVLRSRNQWLSEQENHGKHTGRWTPGPDLAHIGGHKREIRRLRRLRGKPIKGEQSHVDLQQHIDGMGTDRFKKAARAIVNFALNIESATNARTGEKYPRADVLILEKLAGFIPDSERERGINRALVAWNRGQLVNRIKEVAADAGLKIFEVHPAGTSQCCSKCGAMGRRFSIVRDDQSKLPTIRFGWVEKLFACPNPECPGRNPRHPNRPFTCNADHNASVNLHRRFILNEQAVAAFFAWKAKSDTDREESLREIDKQLLPHLERLHGLPFSQPDLDDTPF